MSQSGPGPDDLALLTELDGPARAFGLRYEEVGSKLVRASLPVSDVVRQPGGVVHGGVYALIAESLASVGTMVGVGAEGKVALGQSNSATFLRSVAAGTIHARARRHHAGRTSWVWDVELSDDEGRLCALVRLIIAVRPRREGASDA